MIELKLGIIYLWSIIDQIFYDNWLSTWLRFMNIFLSFLESFHPLTHFAITHRIRVISRIRVLYSRHVTCYQMNFCCCNVSCCKKYELQQLVSWSIVLNWHCKKHTATNGIVWCAIDGGDLVHMHVSLFVQHSISYGYSKLALKITLVSLYDYAETALIVCSFLILCSLLSIVVNIDFVLIIFLCCFLFSGLSHYICEWWEWCKNFEWCSR